MQLKNKQTHLTQRALDKAFNSPTNNFPADTLPSRSSHLPNDPAFWLDARQFRSLASAPLLFEMALSFIARGSKLLSEGSNFHLNPFPAEPRTPITWSFGRSSVNFLLASTDTARLNTLQGADSMWGSGSCQEHGHVL